MNKAGFSMLDEQDWQRLARYVTGESDAVEREATLQWIGSDPERAGLAEQMREVYGAATPAKTWNSAASWSQLATRVNNSEANPVSIRKPAPMKASLSSSRTKWATRISAIAAAVVVIVVGKEVFQRSPQPAQTLPTPMNEIATRRAERTTIQLVDGTRIVLNVDSRLRYAQNYGVSSRDVYLDGEAYFDVVHNSQKPFIVHTRSALTEDIGTAFVVRSYAEDSSTRVVVTSGKVALHPPLTQASSPTLLTAGDLGRLRANGTVAVQHDVGTGQYTAFTEGRIVFDDVPVRDALRQLARWYDLDFQLTDSAFTRHRITASFRGESPEKVIAFIAFTLKAEYEQYGRTVVFSSQSHKP